MKKGKYSKREIKKFMTAGIIISAVELLIMVLVFAGQIQSIIFKVFCIIICGALWAGWTAAFYEKIYKPNLELEALIEEYSGKAEYTSGDEAVKGDMIQEIKEIIRFLDTIAVKQKNAEILMKNAEINNLQDQINPHFLYNTLEVIRGEALAVGEKRIAEMTASLANYFRYNISRKEAFVFLKDELKNIRNYFNIQKNRFGKKISFEILYHGIEEKEVGLCYIPKLILQPIIENCIYHGLELKMGTGIIRLHITGTDSGLKINVTDDGLGMTQEQLDMLNQDVDEDMDAGEEKSRHNKVAMKNIKKRLKLYWGDAAYMVVTSELGIGTQVHLSMPLLYEKEEYMNKS